MAVYYVQQRGKYNFVFTFFQQLRGSYKILKTFYQALRGRYVYLIKYEKRILGRHRIANDIEGFLLYVGQDAKPDLSGMPLAYFTAKPYLFEVDPGHDYYFIVRYRNTRTAIISRALKTMDQIVFVFTIDSSMLKRPNGRLHPRRDCRGVRFASRFRT